MKLILFTVIMVALVLLGAHLITEKTKEEVCRPAVGAVVTLCIDKEDHH